MATTETTRRKVEAGNYLIEVEDGERYRVARNDDGDWVTTRLVDDGEQPIETFGTLSGAEEALAELDVESSENGGDPEAEGEGPAPGTAMSTEPAEEVDHPEGCVAWAIPSNPNSKLHRVGNDEGTKTACNLDIPQDGRSLKAPANRGRCGNCFRD